MTLAELSAGEIFAGVTHIIQKQTGISELEAFPRGSSLPCPTMPGALFRMASVAALYCGSGPQIAAGYLNRRVFTGALRQSRELTGLEGFLA